MAQHKEWDREYKNQKLISGSEEPQNDFKRFCKYLKKEQKVDFEDLRVLDLGSGTGKNSIYLATKGAITTGLEISETAINIARKRAENNKVSSEFIQRSFGETFPLADNSFDLVLDIMSSNSLNEDERKNYLKETSRTLTTGGYFFVRLLALDGDKHAQTLLKNNPGKEPGTYLLPDINIVERVFSRDEFAQYYSPFFKILRLNKKSGYAHVGERIFKRQYWIGYLQKP